MTEAVTVGSHAFPRAVARRRTILSSLSRFAANPHGLSPVLGPGAGRLVGRAVRYRQWRFSTLVVIISRIMPGSLQ